MSQPPETARRLLAGLLPRAERQLVLGELEDLFRLRVDRVGVGPANRWYWRQVVNFPVRLLVDRTARRMRAFARPRVWGEMMSLDALYRDVKYAFRRFWLAPGFSFIAVLSLALGIGANTAMFSIVNAILLRDPPYEDVEELAEVYTSDSSGTLYATWSFPDFADLREQSAEIFQEVAMANTFVAVSGPADQPEVILGEAVSGNSLRMQGIPAFLGRTFGPEEDGPTGESPVVILSHGTWKGRFGGDPAVLGQSLRINQLNYTIVGVMPEWFTGSFPAFSSAAWVPLNMAQQVAGATDDPALQRGHRSGFVRARLVDGVTIERANAWLVNFAQGLGETYPDTNKDRIYTALALSDIMVHPFVDRALLPVAGFLMAMVGLVLLIACANLASFLLARAEQRRKEIAVRLSLGAGRLSLIRQLLVESTLLALAGGIGGVLLAGWTVDALVSIRPPIPIPLNLDFPLDGTVLAFTLGVSVVAGALFGLLPALQSTKPDMAPTLREEGGAASGRSRMRNALVVAQVSLSLVLLIGSGLFMRSLLNAQDADPGFYTGKAAIIWPQLSMTGMSDDDGRVFWRTLEERLVATPGITGVTFTDNLPLGFGVQTTTVEIPGIPGPRTDGAHDVDFSNVSPSYFSVMEIDLIRGRAFSEEDVEGGEPVFVVSRAFEQAFFPNGAVGQRVKSGETDYTIVGVAEDSKVRTIGESPRPRLYRSTTQTYLRALQVITRGTGGSAEILRRTVDGALEVQPNLVLFDKRTMEEHLSVHLFPPRMAALLLSVFGGLALLLAGVGIWGVVSHTVARRTKEVGIRVAIGATGPDVVRLLVGGGMRVVAIGVVVGVVLAAAASTLVGRFLYGVGSLDPMTFTFIPVLLALVALGAAWMPARRAAAVDPVRALRSE